PNRKGRPLPSASALTSTPLSRLKPLHRPGTSCARTPPRISMPEVSSCAAAGPLPARVARRATAKALPRIRDGLVLRGGSFIPANPIRFAALPRVVGAPRTIATPAHHRTGAGGMIFCGGKLPKCHARAPPTLRLHAPVASIDGARSGRGMGNFLNGRMPALSLALARIGLLAAAGCGQGRLLRIAYGDC